MTNIGALETRVINLIIFNAIIIIIVIIIIIIIIIINCFSNFEIYRQ